MKTAPADLSRLSERHGGKFPRQLVLDAVTGSRPISAHGSREMPVWGRTFSQRAGGAAVGAAIYTQRLLNRILEYLESIQARHGTAG